MFEHFKAFLANKRNRTTIALVAGFLIFLAILKYFGLYEGFKSKYEREEIMKKSLTNLQNDVAKASELTLNK